MKSAGEHEPQHAEVADEGPEGMAEGGGLVAFDQEVARPALLWDYIGWVGRRGRFR